jgi:lipopolysaccharide export system protein LptC
MAIIHNTRNERAGGAAPRSAARRGSARDAAVLPLHLAADPAFLAAARHSRHVRIMRRAIPLLCIGGVVALVLRTFIGSFTTLPGDFGVARMAIEGQKIVMDKPRLSGFKRDGSSYEMTAATAVQDLRVPNMMELNTLHARIQNGERGWTNLWGDSGLYDSKAERLDVSGNVRVRTDAGTEADLFDAAIEFKGGNVTTQKAAEVRSPQGKINSDRMQVLDNGKHMVFEGNVRSIFVNSTPGAKPSDEP